MSKKLTLAEKIANKAVKSAGTTEFQSLINKITDKEALAVACVHLDHEVSKSDFETWRTKGFSKSKRSMRVMHNLLGSVEDPVIQAVLEAKNGYLYSVCKKQNEAQTAAYRAVRKDFLVKLDNLLAKME